MTGVRSHTHDSAWLTLLPYALIAVGALLRILPHGPNFAPIGALALFGGAVLPGGVGIAVPLGALVLSDAILGFYPGIGWVYGSFVLIALLGLVLRRRRTAARIVSTSLAASVLFFVITNFGEWFGPLYPHTLAGLRQDYVAAIPFFRNTALSDLCYSLALFAIYESATRLARRRAEDLAPAVHRTT